MRCDWYLSLTVIAFIVPLTGCSGGPPIVRHELPAAPPHFEPPTLSRGDPFSDYTYSFTDAVLWVEGVLDGEVRAFWFLNGDPRYRMKCRASLLARQVVTIEDVYNWGTKGEWPRDLTDAEVSALRTLLSNLPPSQGMFEPANLLVVSVRENGQTRTETYRLSAPPKEIIQLYALLKAYLLGQPVPGQAR